MSTILAYWRACEGRGNKPRAVWAMVSEGGQQPIGYILMWSISKRAVTAEMDKRANAGKWRAVRIAP